MTAVACGTVLHRPGSVVADALTVLRAPAVLGCWLHAQRLAEMLASDTFALRRPGKKVEQIYNELRSKLLPRVRVGAYPDLEARSGSLVRAISLPAVGLPLQVPGFRPLSQHEQIQRLLAGHHLERGDDVYLPPGDRGRHEDLRDRLTRSLPDIGHTAATRSLIQVDVVVLRGGRLHRLYEVEMRAGKSTKALVRLGDVLGVAGEPPGGLYVVTPDTQVSRLTQELQRPMLQGLQRHCRILSQSMVEDPFA